PTPFEQPGSSQKKGAHADGRHVLCAIPLVANEIDRHDVCERIYNARTAGQANQVERRTIFKGASRHDTETLIAHHWQHGLRNNMGLGLRELASDRDRWRRSNSAQDFKWAGEV